MASGIIWTPEERTTRPSGIGRLSDGSGSLTNGLLVLWTPNQSKTFRNVAKNNAAATVTTDNTSLVQDGKGSALQHSISASNIVMGFGETIPSGTAARITIGVISSWNEGPNPIVYTEASSGILTVATNWPDITSVSWWGGGIARETVIPGAAQGAPWLCGYDGTSVWVGSKTTYQAWAETGAARAFSDARLYLQWDGQGAAPLTRYIAIWNRSLSRAEQIQWATNPWQLFEADDEPVFYSLGGGSPYSMDAEAGSYALTGVATIFQASRTLTAEAGSYALTGVDATFKASRTILADAGSYVVSGQDVTFTYTPVGSGSPYSMDADAGSYTITGVDATFKASRTIVAEAGSYVLTGVDASFTRSEYRLVAETGSYVISGQEATFSTTGTVTPTGGRGGNGTGRNLSRKQKKKLKAVESQEWLKAEETARQLLSDRFTKQTPQEKAEALQTYVESLQPVIEALKALTTQVEEVAEVVEEIPVVEITPHQEILSRFDILEKKLKSVEELVIILMADL